MVRIWELKIGICIPESRIFSHKIEKSLKLSSSIMTFRKILIYFDLREGKKNPLRSNILFHLFPDSQSLLIYC